MHQLDYACEFWMAVGLDQWYRSGAPRARAGVRYHSARKSADGSILHLAIGQWYRSAGRARARVKYAYSECQSDQIMHVQ